MGAEKSSLSLLPAFLAVYAISLMSTHTYRLRFTLKLSM